NGRGLPARGAQHGLVLGLPPRTRATPAPARRGHEHGLGGPRSAGQLWRQAPRGQPHQPSNRLLNMSSMKKNGSPRLWRSLAEYEQDPEFVKFVQNEFGVPLTEAPPNSKERRRFMQLMAASFSLAG